MRLLDRGPHTVVVTPMVRGRDSTGGATMTPGTPVEVSGVMVQPATASESGDSILTATTTYHVIGAGAWPGGVRSRVSWNGREFDQFGEPMMYSVSPTTAHFDVIITARSSEVK